MNRHNVTFGLLKEKPPCVFWLETPNYIGWALAYGDWIVQRLELPLEASNERVLYCANAFLDQRRN